MVGSSENFYEWELEGDGRRCSLRPLAVEELAKAQELYRKTYGDRYGLAEVMEPRRSLEVAKGEDWLWLVTECEGEIIASVIFGVELPHLLGKSFAGVVSSRFRGHGIMPLMVEKGVGFVEKRWPGLPAMYAVVRTFIPLKFHEELLRLGFEDVGIFPNVRKAIDYETHGLKVRLGKEGYHSRKKDPQLLESWSTLYQICAQRLGLEPPVLIDEEALDISTLSYDKRDEELELSPLSREEILEIYHSLEGCYFDFYPFHEPTLLLCDLEMNRKVFLSYQSQTKHVAILGVECPEGQLASTLKSASLWCSIEGAAYLELIVSAYDPLMQKVAISQDFLPCAYFPSARLKDGQREDVVVASKTFMPLHFRGLKLPESSKPYLLEYFKLYSSMLWRDLMEA